MFGFLNKIAGPKVDLAEKISEGAIILDVRTKGEFASGHVKGSRNVPLDQLQSQIKKIQKENKVVITCCASGMRSGTAKNMLRNAGVECYNGGSWVSVQRQVLS